MKRNFVKEAVPITTDVSRFVTATAIGVFAILLLFSSAVYAQKERIIVGQITDDENQPMKGILQSENTTYNWSLFHSPESNEAEWWDNLVEEFAYAGFDYVTANN